MLHFTAVHIFTLILLYACREIKDWCLMKKGWLLAIYCVAVIDLDLHLV